MIEITSTSETGTRIPTINASVLCAAAQGSHFRRRRSRLSPRGLLARIDPLATDRGTDLSWTD
jgi:hypothetical protein